MDHLMIASLAAQQIADHSEMALATGLAQPGRGVPGRDYCASGGPHMPPDECDCFMDTGD